MEELIPFLENKKSLEVRKSALESVLGLTGDSASLGLISKCPQLVSTILVLATTDPDEGIQSTAIDCLLNISAEAEGAEAIFQHQQHFYPLFLKMASGDDLVMPKITNMAANLMSFSPEMCLKLMEFFEYRGFIPFLNEQFFKSGLNKNMEGIVNLMLNLSTSEKSLKILLDANGYFLKYLLFEVSRHREKDHFYETRLKLLRNCCLATSCVSNLIAADAAQSIIHPLAGPGDYKENELDEELRRKYNREQKKREPSPEFRKLLLESLLLLGATVEGREYLRKGPVYPVLRELYNWEETKSVRVAIYNVVTLIIGEEPGVNLKELDIPPELQSQFVKWDKEDLQ